MLYLAIHVHKREKLLTSSFILNNYSFWLISILVCSIFVFLGKVVHRECFCLCVSLVEHESSVLKPSISVLCEEVTKFFKKKP